MTWELVKFTKPEREDKVKSECSMDVIPQRGLLLDRGLNYLLSFLFFVHLVNSCRLMTLHLLCFYLNAATTENNQSKKYEMECNESGAIC